MNFQASLTKRQVRLQKLSTILDWEYLAEPVSDSGDLEKFLFFKTKLINYQYNSLKSKNNITSLFDLSYSEGAFIAKENLEATFLKIKSPKKSQKSPKTDSLKKYKHEFSYKSIF